MKGVQLPLLTPVLPSMRGRGWISHGDRVVLVVVQGDNITVRTGHVESAKDSHMGVDNVNSIVVWGDEPFYHNVDSAEDAYEKTFSVQNPYIIKADDLEFFRINERLAREWLAQAYPSTLATKIMEVLLSTDLNHREDQVFSV